MITVQSHGIPVPLLITVNGDPATQGSKKAFPVRRKDGTVTTVIVEDNPVKHRTWRAEIVAACREYTAALPGWAPLEGPVALEAEFRLHRPKLVPKERRGWPSTKPDLGKLVRALEDGLKVGGLYRDDGQVCAHGRMVKRYCEAGEVPGVTVKVWQIP